MIATSSERLRYYLNSDKTNIILFIKLYDQNQQCLTHLSILSDFPYIGCRTQQQAH